MTSAVHFVNNIDAMLGKAGPVKMATLPAPEQREVRLYYGLRELSQEVGELKTMLQDQQRQTAQLEAALRALLSRTR